MCARSQGSESGAPSFFYLFLLKNGLFGKTSLFIQVFFVTLHAKSIAWNIKQARISDRLEYQIDYNMNMYLK